ncbi:serine/threonine-protein kinase [Kineosporia sp. A_224]|uniref:serine/threonine-protein kinase n=1 Tax=Kineosporia sp. A_224 TaxID=1962180 RepID=UPI0013043D85|nr:serine/threonine-protein kinase [Kineosporia sp. A_224]
MAPPTTVGRFRVQRSLGSGGFATVWLAEDPQLDSLVAVKILADNWAANADVHRRFVDEARLLRRVDSDHLVRVYDIGELDEGRPYFVMSYADGGTLADLVKDRPPPWQPDDVLAVVDGISAALTVLHRSGIVHRDVKPANVLFRTAVHADRATGPLAGKRVMLGDLGIAKDLQWASGLTLPAGSPAFMAPEQRDMAGRITPATDVHAFAMTVGRLLGIAAPWPETALGDVLRRATAERAEDRTATAAELAAELRGGLAPWRRGAGPMPTSEVAAALTVPIPIGTGLRVPDPPAPVSPAPASEVSVLQVPAAPVPSLAPAEPLDLSPPVTPPPGPAPSSAPARGPRRDRRRLLTGAAVLAVLVLGAVLTSRYLLTTHRLAPTDGGASVAIPRSWDTEKVAGVSFPGADDPDSGARAGAGARAVTVAYSDTYTDPAQVLRSIEVSGCATTTASKGTVGKWPATLWRRTGCADAAVVQDVVLANQGTDEFTVWVQVRSVDGDPDLEEVLGSLRVD